MYHVWVDSLLFIICRHEYIILVIIYKLYKIIHCTPRVCIVVYSHSASAPWNCYPGYDVVNILIICFFVECFNFISNGCT